MSLKIAFKPARIKAALADTTEAGCGRENKKISAPPRLGRRVVGATFQTAYGVLPLPGCRQIEMDADNRKYSTNFWRAPTALGVTGSVRPTVQSLLNRVNPKSGGGFFDRVTARRKAWDEMEQKRIANVAFRFFTKLSRLVIVLVT